MILKIVLSNGEEVNVDASPDDTVAQVLAKLNRMEGIGISDKSKLITDNSKQLQRILRTDPVNQWFDGKVGDIYRIESTDGVRFRRVT